MTIIRRKTAKKFSVPIFPQLRPMLERMRGERRDLDAAAKVFSAKDPKVAIDNACKRLNFPRYSARAFRRMFITRCVELGITPRLLLRGKVTGMADS
jgi:integrase